MRQFKSTLLLLSLLVGSISGVNADQTAAAIIRYNTIHHPVIARHGMVASQNRLASEVGVQILKQGGNAVDAAVAVGFALAVTLPRAGNIGGGGFMLVSQPGNAKPVAIDYRETAPAAAHRDLFLDSRGNVDQALARFSHRSAGIPGTVAGLHLAWSEFGSMPWRDLLQPAVQLAERGFTINFDLAENLKQRHQRLIKNPATAATFFKNGKPYAAGDLLKQPELAASLKLIAEQGPDAFYQGQIADLIVAEMQKHAGLITKQDLQAYQPAMRKPVQASFGQYNIFAMPPPSSGGIHLLQMLNVLQELPVDKAQPRSAQTIHWLAETMKRAYADRSKHLGDPDFYPVPINWLLSTAYAKSIAASINTRRATPSGKIRPGTAPTPESPDTTHFSIIDRHGNAVSNTYTLNFSYGSGITVPGAGFILNNEMDDFSAKPGVPNAFGLLGAEANAINPGKRPLSSMTPVILFKNGELFMVTGSPGGSRIITTVFQQIFNVIFFDMNIAEATHTPRIHHQWYPDVLELEPGFSADTLQRLKKMRHTVKYPSPTMGSLQSIVRRDGLLFGAADPRRPNALAIGY